MAELMPADGKELERVDEDAHAGYVPEREYYDGVYSDLRVRGWGGWRGGQEGAQSRDQAWETRTT